MPCPPLGDSFKLGLKGRESRSQRTSRGFSFRRVVDSGNPSQNGRRANAPSATVADAVDHIMAGIQSLWQTIFNQSHHGCQRHPHSK